MERTKKPCWRKQDAREGVARLHGPWPRRHGSARSLREDERQHSRGSGGGHHDSRGRRGRGAALSFTSRCWPAIVRCPSSSLSFSSWIIWTPFLSVCAVSIPRARPFITCPDPNSRNRESQLHKHHQQLIWAPRWLLPYFLFYAGLLVVGWSSTSIHISPTNIYVVARNNEEIVFLLWWGTEKRCACVSSKCMCFFREIAYHLCEFLAFGPSAITKEENIILQTKEPTFSRKKHSKNLISFKY